MSPWKARITVDPSVLVTKPIIKCTRFADELLIDRMAYGSNNGANTGHLLHLSLLGREKVLATNAPETIRFHC